MSKQFEISSDLSVEETKLRLIELTGQGRFLLSNPIRGRLHGNKLTIYREQFFQHPFAPWLSARVTTEDGNTVIRGEIGTRWIAYAWIFGFVFFIGSIIVGSGGLSGDVVIVLGFISLCVSAIVIYGRLTGPSEGRYLIDVVRDSVNGNQI